MKPTIEEIKKVIGESEGVGCPVTAVSYEELQAFAQHYKEEGRKEQRDSDAELIRLTDLSQCDSQTVMFLSGMLLAYEKAIRNNTGE